MPTTPVTPDKPGATPAIATPAPDAPPDKVQEAKDIANTAALTPIIPSPGNPARPAFQLYVEIDAPILAIGTVFAFARLTRTQPAFCAPRCDTTTLTGLLGGVDKLTAGYYSAGWSTASDYSLAGLGVAAAAVLLADEGALDALNDAVVIAESTLSATAVASIMTLAAGRPRPLLYGDPANPGTYQAPESVRNGADAGLSFLSSHTAMAFAITTSLAMTERRLHPHSRRATIFLATGLAVSSFIGLARIESGFHFITDVVGGGLVGASLGVLVTSMHGSPVHVVPIVGDTRAGLGISSSF